MNLEKPKKLDSSSKIEESPEEIEKNLITHLLNEAGLPLTPIQRFLVENGIKVKRKADGNINIECSKLIIGEKGLFPFSYSSSNPMASLDKTQEAIRAFFEDKFGLSYHQDYWIAAMKAEDEQDLKEKLNQKFPPKKEAPKRTKKKSKKKIPRWRAGEVDQKARAAGDEIVF